VTWKKENVKAANDGTITTEFGGMPPWMAKMRAAVCDIITPGDIEEIVKNQVARAKSGDPAAIKFVFDQLLGGGMKGATFIQNNNYGDEGAGKPSNAVPGTPAKLDLIRRRVEAGLPACNPSDRDDVDLS
jgi:hypothetical protein